jgi:RHS repeat-associated protein
LGSVRDIIDTSGSLIKELRYDSYGNIVSETGSGQRGSLLYASYRHDPITGNYNTKYRTYNPTTGQWHSDDPIGLAGGDSNVRRYVGNNGANGNDSSGLYEIPQMMEALKRKNEPMYLTAKFFLENDMLAIATENLGSPDIRKRVVPPSVSKDWAAHTDNVLVDITSRRTTAFK